MLQVVLSADPSATGSADVHYLPAICIGSPEFCAWIRLKCVACKFCLVNETEKCHVHPSQLRIVLPETEPVLIPGLFASPRSTVVVGRSQVLTQLVLLHEQLWCSHWADTATLSSNFTSLFHFSVDSVSKSVFNKFSEMSQLRFFPVLLSLISWSRFIGKNGLCKHLLRKCSYCAHFSRYQTPAVALKYILCGKHQWCDIESYSQGLVYVHKLGAPPLEKDFSLSWDTEPVFHTCEFAYVMLGWQTMVICVTKPSGCLEQMLLNLYLKERDPACLPICLGFCLIKCSVF